MYIKLDQSDIQTAIKEYLEKRGVQISEGDYTETYVKHTKTHTKNTKGVSKKLKKPQEYEFFWYTDGHEYNQENIEFTIFVDKDSIFSSEES
jgi:hypothetical protein